MPTQIAPFPVSIQSDLQDVDLFNDMNECLPTDPSSSFWPFLYRTLPGNSAQDPGCLGIPLSFLLDRLKNIF